MAFDDLRSDANLKLLIDSHSIPDSEYWSFRGKAVREHVHAYFQYPAMMVPRMQGDLMRVALQVRPDTKTVSDPFVGSGTAMTEAMLLGLDFMGQDINPLAVLVSRAKSGPHFVSAVSAKTTDLIEAIRRDDGSEINVDFPGLRKWFRKDVAVGLSRIRRAIRRESRLFARRFFWVALAETVRVTSNSRISTFKLHIRPPEEIRSRRVSPIQIFEEVVNRNLTSLRTQYALLGERGLTNRGHYRGNVRIDFGDSTQRNTSCGGGNGYDLLVTSPPYGDNGSTVPYGQHSYLPLQWIDYKDIDRKMSEEWLATTHEIDHRSLGGSRVKALEETNELLEISSSFRRTIKDLRGEPKDRSVRVAAFCRDLNRCLDPILETLRPGAYMMWTMGNRRVAGRTVPADKILIELLSARGATFVTKLQRTIPANSKRMAGKNRIASTMRAEAVVVMRNGTSR